MSGGMAWTIRSDPLELWQGLVLHGMGKIDFHVFWKYWKLTSSPNTSKLVLGPPDWSSDFFESQGTISRAIKPIIFSKNDPTEQVFSGKLDNLPKSSFFYKMASFRIFCFGPHAFFRPHENRDHFPARAPASQPFSGNIHGFPWMSMGYPRISLDIHRYP